jgi:hypothetical protein
MYIFSDVLKESILFLFSDTEFLKEILTQMMVGGQLSVRVGYHNNYAYIMRSYYYDINTQLQIHLVFFDRLLLFVKKLFSICQSRMLILRISYCYKCL